MNEFAVVHTDQKDSGMAGYALGLQIREAMLTSPDVVLLFVSPAYDQGLVLQTLQQVCQPKLLLGCSSAGEFTSKARGVELSCAMAIRSEEMRFSVGIGHHISSDGSATARELVDMFPERNGNYPYQTAIVLADALAGQMDSFLEYLSIYTDGQYQFVGGGAGDNARFHWTPVFYGTSVLADAAVALTIQSKQPIGLGASHGWSPVQPSFQATRVDGMTLVELNGTPAVEVFQRYAEERRQPFDLENPLPFFLHTLVGIEDEGYSLRVPLAVRSDGAVQCAAEIPEQARICLMGATACSPIDAAVEATRQARAQLGDTVPGGALFFDCVTTRLVLGDGFGFELDAVQEHLGPIPYAGCNTQGQIVGKLGQRNAFHNCTAVVCLFPA
jgi:hypothetical protein